MILDKELATKYSNIFNIMYKIEGKNKKNKQLFQRPTFWVHDKNIPVVEQEVKGTDQFKKDVIANKPIEEEFINVYHCHNYNSTAYYELNDTKDFDLKITYTTQDEEGYNKDVYSYIELKNDRMAKKTKNVAIQFYAWGRDSGIRVTKASLWVQRVDGFYIVMKTDKLKELIQRLKPRQVWGGDGGQAKNYLIAVNDLVSIAEAIIVNDYYSF